MTAITATSSAARTNWVGVAFGLAIGALAGYHQFKVPPVLPILLRGYDIDETFGASYMSVYAVVGLLLSGVVGAWQAHRGIAPFVYAALALLAIGNALGLAAPSVPMLFLASRGLEATGFAVLAINCPLLCARHASPRQRMIAVSIGATWIPLGQLFANGVGVVVLTDGNWEMLWWGGLAGCIAFAGLTAVLMRAGLIDLSPPRAPRPGPVEAAVRASAAERRRMRAIWITAGIFTLWSTQMIAYLTWLPEVMVSAFGFTPEEATVAYSLPVAMVLIFNLVGGMMLRHGVPVALLLAGSLALQLAVWVALPWTGSDWTGVVSLIAFGAGAGVTPTCLWSMPSHVFGARAHSNAFAALMTGRSLGALVGPLLLAQAFALTADWNVASPLFAVSTCVAIAGALFLHGRLRHLEPTG